MGSLPETSKPDLTLMAVATERDILFDYRGTVVGDLLAYHNLGVKHGVYTDAELLIGMCMDHRYQLRIPANFAYFLRGAGANLSFVEFDVSFAIAVAGVRSICVIGHDECRMVDVGAKRETFVSGLVDHASWDRHKAEALFDANASRYGFEDVVERVWLAAQRLRETYPGIIVAPLMYSLDDHNLRQVTTVSQSIKKVH